MKRAWEVEGMKGEGRQFVFSVIVGVLVLETVLGEAFLQVWDEKLCPGNQRAKRKFSQGS